MVFLVSVSGAVCVSIESYSEGIHPTNPSSKLGNPLDSPDDLVSAMFLVLADAQRYRVSFKGP